MFQKIKLIIALIMFQSISLFAQNSFDLSKKEATKAQNRKMIFVVEDPSNASNKDWAEVFNENLKSTVKNIWKFNSHYEFKTLDEIKAIQKGKNSKEYAVFFFKDFGKPDLSLTSSFNNAALSTRLGDGDRSVLYFNFMEDFKPMHTSEHFRGSSSLTMITLPHNKITASDIKSGLSLAQAMLYYELNDAKKAELEGIRNVNLKRLKDKTLLVSKELVEKGANFKGNYPYNFEMVTPNELADHIAKPDSNYVYLEIFPFLIQSNATSSTNNIASNSKTKTSNDDGYYLYYIFNTAIGETLVNSRQEIAPNYGSSGMAGPVFSLVKHAVTRNQLNNMAIKGLAKDKL